MKKLVLLAALLGGCTRAISVEETQAALKACEPHGGVHRYLLAPTIGTYAVRCKNGTNIDGKVNP